MTIPRDKTGAAPPGGKRCAIGVIAVLFLFLGGVGTAAAQAIRLFQLEDISGSIEASFLADRQDRSRSSSSGSEFDRMELSQLMHLNTYGYIYHPRFWTFHTGLKLEAIEGLAGQSGDRFFWGGNFRFNFLQEHRNSLSIYGTRLESEFARPFSATYKVTSEEYGATFYQKWGWMPFDLSYQHAVRSGGSGSQLDDSRDTMSFNGHYALGKRSDGKLEYDLAYEDVRGQKLRRQNLFASNESQLGDGSDKALYIDLRLFEERNGGFLRNAAGNAAFDWNLSDNLQAHYALAGRWSDSDAQNVSNLDASYLLTHKLYESLGSDFEIFARFEDASFRKREEFGGRISENYLKRLGDWGSLGISVSPHASVAYNRLDEETASVEIPEAYILLDSVRLVLGQPGVQPDIIVSTIRVTSPNCPTTPCRNLLDYTVEQTGGGFETELRRSVSGGILNGDQVFVTYDFELPGDNDTLTTGVGVRTSLAFLDHWRVFANYDSLDYHVLSGDKGDLRFNSFDRYATGMEFNGQWFAAKARYEQNDASITPSWGYSGSASFFTYGTKSWSGRLGADYAFVNQGNSAQTVNQFSVSAAASKQFFKWGFLEVEGSWRRGRWSGQSSQANDIDTLDLRLRHSWWYGKVEMRLETGFAQILRPTEDRSVYNLNLRVRRVF